MPVHELALTEAVVETIVERLGAARVVRVRIDVGALAAVVPEAMRFAFEVVARGTTLEGAVLEIEESEGAEMRIREVEVQDV
jgi:hydrogenase nickel incorporation protein HypA/HybF